MVPYRAMHDVPHEVVEHVSRLIYARRCELASRWRRLGCFPQALLTLVYLRKNETLAQLGAGFGVSTATAGRYVSETVDILAEHAPSLIDAPSGHDPNEFLILDGTLVRTDRAAADEPYYSMKHRHHGMNVQVLARPDGSPIWYSRALPGRTHDLTAARALGLVRACLSRQILVPADRAHRGAGATVRTPLLRPGPAGAIRTVQPRSRPSSSSRRTRLCLPETVADLPEGAMQSQPAGPSPPFTPSRSPGTQDEKSSMSRFHPAHRGETGSQMGR